jgi:hypothetical protein
VCEFVVNRRTLDGLDRGVGGDLHVRRPEQGGAGVAARDRHDGRHHQVLDEGASDDHLDGLPDSGCFGIRRDDLGDDCLSVAACDSVVSAALHALLVLLVAKEGDFAC